MCMTQLECQKDYYKSVGGILKAVLIVLGGICWGLVYIGDVLSTSNNYPEVNDQALLCAAVTLPLWILTVLLYGLRGVVKSASVLSKIDIAFCIFSALLYAVSTAFCAMSHWFIWWCEDSYVVVDVGDCSDTEVFRNKGQNLAVIILEGVLALGYGLSAMYALCRRCIEKRRSNIDPDEDIDDKETEKLKLGA